jgi:hypothetical protein
MSKRVIFIIVGILAAVVALLYLTQPELFSAAGRRERFLRNFDRSGVVLRRSCYTMETFVDAPRWSSIDPSSQEQAAQSLARYCAGQGGNGQMTILDGESRRKLAHWDGSAFQRF